MTRDRAHAFVPSAAPNLEHTCAVPGCGALELDEEHTGGEGINPPDRVEPHEVAGVRLDLCKRQPAPFRVVSHCPECGKEHATDLNDGDNLYCAQQGVPRNVYFLCPSCDTEWSVAVVVRLTVELHNPSKET